MFIGCDIYKILRLDGKTVSPSFKESDGKESQMRYKQIFKPVWKISSVKSYEIACASYSFLCDAYTWLHAGKFPVSKLSSSCTCMSSLSFQGKADLLESVPL